MRSSSRAALALLVGCAPRSEFLLPAFEDGSVPLGAALLDREATAGFVVDLRQPRNITTDGDDRTDLALLYATPLEALEWIPGALAHDPSGTSRLRRPDVVLRRVGDGWEEVTTAEDVWASLREFRDVREDACGSGATCFDDEGFCIVCPAPAPVVEPTAPIAWTPPVCVGGLRATSTMFGSDMLGSCTLGEPPSCGASARATTAGECLPIGRACVIDAEGWADPPPAPDAAFPGVVVYAATGGSPAGDGTRAAPWDLATALARTSSGATVVVSSGLHAVAEVGGGGPVRLSGACVGTTTISLMFDAVAARAVRLEHATVSVDGHVGARWELAGVDADLSLTVSPGGEIELDSSRVNGGLSAPNGVVSWNASEGREVALEVKEAGRMSIRRSVIKGRLTAGVGGSLEIMDSALSQSDLDDNEVNLYAMDSTVTITRSELFRRPMALGEEAGGEGLRLLDSQVELDLVHLRGHEASAIFAFGPRSHLRAHAVVVEGARVGLLLSDGASAEVDGLAVHAAANFGVHVLTMVRRPSKLTVRDLWVDEVAGDDKNAGIFVQGGALVLERAWMRPGNASAIIAAAESMHAIASLNLQDLTLTETRPVAIELRGAAMYAITATLARVSIADAAGAGVWVHGERGTIAASDLSVRRLIVRRTNIPDCQVEYCDAVGWLWVPLTSDMTARLERFDFQDLGRVGFTLGIASTMRALDGVVDRTPIGVAGPGIESSAQDWRRSLARVRLDADVPSVEDDL